MPPQLILQRNEAASLVGRDGRRLRVQRVEAKIRIVQAVVEKARVQNMLWRKVVLQAQEIVPGPLLECVGVRRKLLHNSKSMLNADRIRKPEAAADERPGKSEPRIPVSQVYALLNVDAGARIGGPEAPAVVPIRSYEAQNIGPGVRIGRINPSRLDFRGPRGIN